MRGGRMPGAFDPCQEWSSAGFYGMDRWPKMGSYFCAVPILNGSSYEDVQAEEG